MKKKEMKLWKNIDKKLMLKKTKLRCLKEKLKINGKSFLNKWDNKFIEKYINYLNFLIIENLYFLINS